MLNRFMLNRALPEEIDDDYRFLWLVINCIM
jgi:hypothetical protein